MKKSFLSVLFSCFFLLLFAKPSSSFFACQNNGFCKLVVIKKTVYYVTKKAIYEEDKKGLKQVVALSFACNSAVGDDDKIWMATENGISLFDSKSNRLSTLLPETITGNITHVETDEMDNIWFTKEWEGCFKIDDKNNVQQIVKVPVTYSLAHTSDSNIWVGTNVGLYKVPVSGKEIVRYAEEGIADNDLPDNLVEQLYETGNCVWAVMPGHLSYIAPGEEEAPDFESIGSKGNDLYNVAQLPNAKQAFLFATRQGILYLPNVQNDDQFRIGEIHQEVKEAAFHLSDENIQKPAMVKDKPVTSIQFITNKVYFLTDNGYWSVPVSFLLKQLKNKQKENEVPQVK